MLQRCSGVKCFLKTIRDFKEQVFDGHVEVMAQPYWHFCRMFFNCCLVSRPATHLRKRKNHLLALIGHTLTLKIGRQITVRYPQVLRIDYKGRTAHDNKVRALFNTAKQLCSISPL